MIIKYFARIFLIFSIIFFSDCKSVTTITIEKSMIYPLKINEIYGNEQDYIEISGLINASSFNYKSIKIANENRTKIILMYGELSTINRNGSGSFNIIVPIEKNINKVIFGNDNEIIWERKSIEKNNPNGFYL